jgi:hypothetical protein
MIILITGICGTGKTWVMNQLKEALEISSVYTYGTGLYSYLKKDGVILVGKYDGSVFEGSDKLSMAVMTSNDKIKPVFAAAKTVVCEGDRFSNGTFIKEFSPFIIRILGDGSAGRIKRGSSQTERHLKSITTRVENIKPDMEVQNSKECFEYILGVIKNNL